LIQTLINRTASFSGSLDKYIKQHQELLERNGILVDMATQICSALKFLENKGITHGDLVIISAICITLR